LDLTQKEFSKKAKIPLRTLASLEINERVPGAGILLKIAQTFNIDLNWLIVGDEKSITIRSPITKYDMGKLISLPILGRVPAGYPMTAIEEIDGYFPLPRKLIDDPKAFILKVQGDSMEPDLFDGDLVVISPAQKTEIKGNGEHVIVRCNTDEVAVKLVHKEKRGIILSSRNPKYPPRLITDDETLEIIGKVILKIHFY
jgi:SOS-response transcriptional repressor LexA